MALLVISLKNPNNLLYVFQLGIRGFNKIKLLNCCVGLSGPSNIGLLLKSSGQWTWIYSESPVFITFFIISDLCTFGKQENWLLVNLI